MAPKELSVATLSDCKVFSNLATVNINGRLEAVSSAQQGYFTRAQGLTRWP
jgi:hypothetical protein